jgi:hypothetical protein
MAIDNTPPRLKLIVTIAVITVITLIGINFVTESYYAMMTDEAQREKLAPTREKEEQHKAEQAAFANAALPLDKAIAELSKGDRPSSITPEQSPDLGPMTGWSKLPKPAPTPQPAGAQIPVVVGDAGTEAVGDAGASALAAGDAGAPHGDAGAHAPPAPHAGDAGTHAPGHH